MPDSRPCCILGVCCPPGGAAQRADLKAWLLEKLAHYHLAPVPEEDELDLKGKAETVDGWLDELYAKADEDDGA